MGRRFAKYEGLGNDFVVIPAPMPTAISREEAARLCDRRFGIGADGVLVVSPPTSKNASVAMRVINADGSVPEMCGNGIRCVALHEAIGRGDTDLEVTIDTDAGPRTCRVRRVGVRASVRVDMGRVRYEGDREIEVASTRYRVAIGDAGNPHAILFGEFDAATVDRVGPALATHTAFPRGTNVEFATVRDGALDVVVWERGVGRTLACGTGACATAVAAVAKGLLPKARVRVSLPGGDLDIEPSEDGNTFMTGPARRVFEGETSDEDEA